MDLFNGLEHLIKGAHTSNTKLLEEYVWLYKWKVKTKFHMIGPGISIIQ